MSGPAVEGGAGESAETCKFSILIKRSAGSYSEEELGLMTEKQRRYLDTRKATGGTAYVQLEDENGNIKSFALKPGGSTTNKAGTLAMAGAAAAGLTVIGAPLGVPYLGLLPLPVLGLMQRGEVVEKAKAENFYDDRVDIGITREKYDEIVTDLETNRHRIYSPLFRNCATFAVGVAEKAGLELPHGFIVTPGNMSRQIQEMSAEYQRIHQEFSEADERIDAAFSADEMAPKPAQPVPVSLMDRLKSPNGLGF